MSTMSHRQARRAPETREVRYATHVFERDTIDSRLLTQVFLGMALSRATAQRATRRAEPRCLPAPAFARADVA